MNINPQCIIDLTEYGMDGQIVMGPPTLRKRIMFQNGMKDNLPSGDMAIRMLILYVRSAPFELTPNGFLDYCDRMDENRIGSAKDMFTRMEAIAVSIEKGELSPFAESPSQETATSV